MRFRDDEEESSTDRRLLLLLLVVLLVFVGSGIGTFLFDDTGPGDANVTAPTATPTGISTPIGGGPPVTTGTPTPDDPTATSGTPADAATETQTNPPDDDDWVGDERNDDDENRARTPSPGLELGDDQPLLSEANLVPGQSGEGTMTVRNANGESGTLTISALGITDDENGITDPERSVDSSPEDGELSSKLEVRLAIRDPAGNEEYLLGTESGYVTLEELPDRVPSDGRQLAAGQEVTMVADWRLRGSAGNEIQSDGVSIDLGLTLESSL